MNANDNEGHDSRQDDMLAEHQRPEDRAPLAADGKRYPDGSWQALADEDDTQPVSFSDRVQFAPPSVLVGCPPLPSEQEARIAELEAAIRAMVQEACEADELKPNHWCAVIMDIGWEALGK